MNGTCKGRCTSDPALKLTPHTKFGRDVTPRLLNEVYYNGTRKRCNTCEIKVETELVRCECCNMRLVYKNKHSNAQAKRSVARI